MLAGVAALPWQDQIAYHRARAAEYEVTSYQDVHGADRRIAGLVARLRPGGDVLEIACGTGMWTRHLAACATAVTAIDAERRQPRRSSDSVRSGPATVEPVAAK